MRNKTKKHQHGEKSPSLEDLPPTPPSRPSTADTVERPAIPPPPPTPPIEEELAHDPVVALVSQYQDTSKDDAIESELEALRRKKAQADANALAERRALTMCEREMEQSNKMSADVLSNAQADAETKAYHARMREKSKSPVRSSYPSMRSPEEAAKYLLSPMQEIKQIGETRIGSSSPIRSASPSDRAGASKPKKVGRGWESGSVNDIIKTSTSGENASVMLDPAALKLIQILAQTWRQGSKMVRRVGMEKHMATQAMHQDVAAAAGADVTRYPTWLPKAFSRVIWESDGKGDAVKFKNFCTLLLININKLKRISKFPDNAEAILERIVPEGWISTTTSTSPSQSSPSKQIQDALLRSRQEAQAALSRVNDQARLEAAQRAHEAAEADRFNAEIAAQVRAKKEEAARLAAEKKREVDEAERSSRAAEAEAARAAVALRMAEDAARKASADSRAERERAEAEAAEARRLAALRAEEDARQHEEENARRRAEEKEATRLALEEEVRRREEEDAAKRRADAEAEQARWLAAAEEERRLALEAEAERKRAEAEAAARFASMEADAAEARARAAEEEAERLRLEREAAEREADREREEMAEAAKRMREAAMKAAREAAARERAREAEEAREAARRRREAEAAKNTRELAAFKIQWWWVGLWKVNGLGVSPVKTKSFDPRVYSPEISDYSLEIRKMLKSEGRFSPSSSPTFKGLPDAGAGNLSAQISDILASVDFVEGDEKLKLESLRNKMKSHSRNRSLSPPVRSTPPPRTVHECEERIVVYDTATICSSENKWTTKRGETWTTNAPMSTTAQENSTSMHTESVRKELHMSAVEIQRLELAFAAMDVNRNGSISYNEFTKILKNDKELCVILSRGILSPTGKSYLDLNDTSTIWHLIDADVAGGITLQEMKDFWQGPKKQKRSPSITRTGKKNNELVLLGEALSREHTPRDSPRSSRRASAESEATVLPAEQLLMQAGLISPPEAPSRVPKLNLTPPEARNLAPSPSKSPSPAKVSGGFEVVVVDGVPQWRIKTVVTATDCGF